MEEDPEIPIVQGNPGHDEELNEYVFQLLEKGWHCDEIELNLILKQAYHHVGLERFITNIVVPFLKEVGKKWESHEWDEYQESVSSLVVRDFLVQIREIILIEKMRRSFSEPVCQMNNMKYHFISFSCSSC